MRYPVALEPGSETTMWGAIVPDLPGCFSAGDTLEEALKQVKEAMHAWVASARDANETIPPPSSIPIQRRRNPEYAAWIWTTLVLDAAKLDGTQGS